MYVYAYIHMRIYVRTYLMISPPVTVITGGMVDQQCWISLLTASTTNDTAAKEHVSEILPTALDFIILRTLNSHHSCSVVVVGGY